ncbi:MAG: histidine phosphotransferase family protein, partial [Alphaproteobacteria bacterium]
QRNGDVAVDLFSFSAEQANAKLKTLRMAYGLGGADESIKLEQIHQYFGEYIAGDKRVTQDWDPRLDLGFEPRRGFPKLLMCALLLLADSLPKGGQISLEADAGDAVRLSATGERAALRDDFLPALMLETSVEKLDAKLIHPYIMGLFADKYDYEICVDETGDDFIALRLKQIVVS